MAPSPTSVPPLSPPPLGSPPSLAGLSGKSPPWLVAPAWPRAAAHLASCSCSIPQRMTEKRRRLCWMASTSLAAAPTCTCGSKQNAEVVGSGLCTRNAIPALSEGQLQGQRCNSALAGDSRRHWLCLQGMPKAGVPQTEAKEECAKLSTPHLIPLEDRLVERGQHPGQGAVERSEEQEAQCPGDFGCLQAAGAPQEPHRPVHCRLACEAIPSANQHTESIACVNAHSGPTPGLTAPASD